MVYVFGGIDLPVFEILFIVSVLMVIGLTVIILGVYYILKEIQAMTGLIKREEKDIQEFDLDVNKLEKLDSSDSQLKAYVKSCRDKGYSWAQIKKALKDSGWDEASIAEVAK